MTVGEFGIDFSLFPPPLKIDYKKTNIVERKTLEIDPNKLKPGELTIVNVKEWFGLKNHLWAVMNIDGKRVLIEQLGPKEEKRKATPVRTPERLEPSQTPNKSIPEELEAEKTEKGQISQPP